MIEKIKNFKHKILENKSIIIEIINFGSPRISEDSKELASFLEKFSENIENILLLSKSIDDLTFTRFNNILGTSNIENIVSQLSFISNMNEFGGSEEDTICRKFIVALNRLDDSISSIIQKYEFIQNNNDEIFEPSNINKDVIIEYLDQALIGIEKATIQKEEKQKLIIYIKETRREVIKESTTWKNVIGALVITAAIISGIADAEGAYKNINKAITHIMGSSIQKTIPSIFENLNIEAHENKMLSNDDSTVLV